MIIGKYSVNPLDVLYGAKNHNSDLPIYEIIIYIEVGDNVFPLSQVTNDFNIANNLMDLIEKCVNERKKYMLDDGNDKELVDD